jgi:hypothetical protein
MGKERLHRQWLRFPIDEGQNIFAWITVVVRKYYLASLVYSTDFDERQVQSLDTVWVCIAQWNVRCCAGDREETCIPLD